MKALLALVKKHGFVIGLILVVGVVAYSMGNHGGGVDRSSPPTDSGFAQVLLPGHRVQPALVYKYGKGKNAYYKEISERPVLDSTKTYDSLKKKDTTIYHYRFGIDGEPAVTKLVIEKEIPEGCVMQFMSLTGKKSYKP